MTSTSATRPVSGLDYLLDNMVGCFCAFDRDWRFIRFNAASEHYFGIKREDAVGRHVLDVFPSLAGSVFEQHYRRVLATGESVEFEADSAARAGRRVHVRAFPFEDGVGVSFEDQTERWVAETRSLQSESKLRRLVSSDLFGVMVSHVSGSILDANDAFLRMVGQDRSDLEAGRLRWDLMTPPEFRARDAEAIAEGKATGATSLYEKAFFHKQGHHVPALVGFAQLDDSDVYIGFVLDLTERKRTEQELAENRRLFQTIAELSPDLIYIHDLDTGRNVYANPGLTRILGYTPEQVQAMGTRLAEHLLHSDDWDRSAEDHDRFRDMPDGRVLEYDVRLRHADGSWRTLHSRRVVFARDAEGRTTQILGVAQDITDRRRTEEALLTNKARYRTLFEQAAVGIEQVGLDGRLLHVNDKLCSIVGRSRDELLGMDFRELTHAEDLEGEERDLTRLIAGEVPSYAVEKRYLCSDGTPVWVRVTSSLASGTDYRISIVEDVSERRRAEADLRVSQARLAAVFDQTTAGLAQTDLEGRFVLVNDRFCALTGRSREELLALRVEDVTHPEDFVANRGLIERAIHAGKPFVIEKRYVRPDGSDIWVRNDVTVIRDEAGRTTGLLAASTDITERRRYEAQRELLMGELDHRAKNMLAVVLAVVRQSARSTASVEDFVEAVTGRVQALALAHDLLGRASWAGIDLGTLLTKEFEPYRSPEGPNVILAGPAATLRPAAAGAVGLVLHELVTNAAKHGALSVPEGTVAVTWSRAERDGALRAVWVESGGPAVVPPSHCGFGTLLVEQSLQHQVGGTIAIDYAPEGFRAEITIPANQLAD